MREKIKDITRLHHIVEAIDNIFEFTNDFKEDHSEIEWSNIIGMRHVLVHGYYQIKNEIVWATIQTELSPLKNQIQLLIDGY